MPIYEYRCSECGFQKEFLQKVSDPRLTTCTSCGKETFQKMLTAAGFQLKGSGWYATDFKNSGSKPVEKSDGSVKSGKPVVSEESAKTESSKSEGGADSGTKATDTAAAPSAPAKSDSSSGSAASTGSGAGAGSTTPV